MTYIHPVLGVPCLSTSEFWKIEGEKEGREAYEVMSDFYDDLAADEEAYCQSLISNKEDALERIKYCYEEDDESPSPTEVLEIWNVDASFGARRSKTSFKCKVRFSDDSIRNLDYNESEYSGSYLEPPDFDCSCEELSD